MMPACRQFLIDRLQGLLLLDGYTKPFMRANPNRTIFFQDMPRDFLKDNDYAVDCLPLIDRNRRSGRIIGRVRTRTAATEDQPEKWHQRLIRRSYDREIMFRVVVYAPPVELYGTDTAAGLMDRLHQAIAGFRTITASDNSAITVDPQDSARPWDSNAEMGRKLDRPPFGIIRVQFRGGIQTDKVESMITRVEINPQYR